MTCSSRGNEPAYPQHLIDGTEEITGRDIDGLTIRELYYKDILCTLLQDAIPEDLERCPDVYFERALAWTDKALAELEQHDA